MANNMNPSIVAFARGDVNGDRVPDNIYLTGVKNPNSPFVQNITLVIQDGRTGSFMTMPLEGIDGYSPMLELKDFTGNGLADILISSATGGSGAIMNYYIYSFANNILTLLFDFNKYNEDYVYTVTYLDNYKVEVTSQNNQEKYIIDISSKGEEYLSEIYDEDGKLINPISGFVDPLSGLYPIDFDSDQIYELLAYQKISGRYHADSLGYFLNTLEWQDNKFALVNQFVAIYGSPLE